jgi:hypothetical protein
MARNRRKSQHKALLQEIAALINQPVDSLAVRLVALARLKLDATEAELLAGNSSATIQDITTLQETFDKYVPKPRIQITVKYADATDAAPADHAAVSGLAECRRCRWRPANTDRWPECPRCGWRHGDDTSAPWQPLIAGIPAPASSPEPAPAATTSPPNVIALDEQRADRSAELRVAARTTAGITPPVQAPRVNYSNPDNESPAALSRRIENAYR